MYDALFLGSLLLLVLGVHVRKKLRAQRDRIAALERQVLAAKTTGNHWLDRYRDTDDAYRRERETSEQLAKHLNATLSKLHPSAWPELPPDIKNKLRH